MFLQIKSVDKSFPDTKKETLRDISLTVEKGEFICIVGPGAGSQRC